MNRQFIGAALAILIVTMAALALPSASGDSPDVREAEIYADSAFAYSPSGDWSDAKASGSALDAGLVWADGTLSGSIGTAGAYRAVIEKADGSVTVELTVIPSASVNYGTEDPTPAPKVSDLKVGSDGRTILVSSGVTDAGKLTYNWGDGTWTILEVESVLQAAQHTYRQEGTYTVIVTAEGTSASAYGVAIFDAPADEPKGFFDEHGWIFLVFAIGGLIAAFLFLYTQDPRFLILAVVLATLTAVTLVMGVKI